MNEWKLNQLKVRKWAVRKYSGWEEAYAENPQGRRENVSLENLNEGFSQEREESPLEVRKENYMGVRS